jgi:hypothetical protein
MDLRRVEFGGGGVGGGGHELDHLAHDRDRWRSLVKCGEFLD